MVHNGVVAEDSLQLFPQGRNVDADRVAEAVDTAVPDVLNQLFLADRPLLMEHQIFQKSQFLSREGKGRPTGFYTPRLCVEGKVSALQDQRVLDHAPPRETPDAGFQFLKVKGLAEIVIRAAVESLDFILKLASGREDEDGGFRILLPDAAEHLHTVHAGEVQIQDDEIVGLCQCHVPGVIPIKAAVDLIPIEAKAFRDTVAQGFFIFND